MLKILTIFFTILLSATSLNAVEDSKNLQKVSLQLHWKYQFEFAGYIMAKEKGFYKDVGLDVELKEYIPNINIIEEVIERKSNYAIFTSRTFLAFLQDKPIRLISSYFKRSALILVTKPEIKSLKDLIGKKVMDNTKKTFNTNFKQLSEFYDLDIEKITVIPHTHNIDDFINSDISAMTAFTSNQPYKLDKLNIKYNIIDPSDTTSFNLQHELFTSTDEVLHNKQRTKAFRDASIKGWKYALKHKRESVNIIYNRYSKLNSKDSLIHEAIEIEKLMLPNVYALGSIDTNYLQKQLIRYKQSHNIASTKEMHDFPLWTRDITKKIDYMLIIKVLLIVLFIASILIYFQAKLAKQNKMLKEQKDIFENLFYKSTNGILLIKENKIYDCNNTFIKMLGYNSKYDLINLTPSNLSPKYQEDSFVSRDKEKQIMSQVSGGNITHFSWLFKKLDEEILYCNVTLTSMKILDENILHATIVDISKEKKLTTKLEELNHNLESKIKEEVAKNQKKGQQMFEQSRLAQMGGMIGMLAHQWRQPLAAISSTTSNLSFKLLVGNLDNDFLTKELELINQYSQKLSVTIDDFRNFYTADKGEKIDINLKIIIEETLSVTKAAAKAKGIDISTSYESRKDVKINTNELKQVILNLFRNSQEILIRKEIKNPYIDIRLYDENDSVIVEIKDNAGGIKEDILPKIFDPYFSTKKEKNAIGLGLYMSKIIIEERYGGLLSASNTTNGAIFRMVI